MALHIIIDGYNLIRRSPRLAGLDRRDLEAGRMALIDMLAGYRRVKQHRITVVFDGAGGAAGALRRDRIKGIDVRFSGPGETADMVIKRMVENMCEAVLVVSSDREVADFATAAGADSLESEGFEQRMAMATVLETEPETERQQGARNRFTTRKKGPARRLSKKQRRRRRMMEKL